MVQHPSSHRFAQGRAIITALQVDTPTSTASRFVRPAASASHLAPPCLDGPDPVGTRIDGLTQQPGHIRCGDIHLVEAMFFPYSRGSLKGDCRPFDQVPVGPFLETHSTPESHYAPVRRYGGHLHRGSVITPDHQTGHYGYYGTSAKIWPDPALPGCERASAAPRDLRGHARALRPDVRTRRRSERQSVPVTPGRRSAMTASQSVQSLVETLHRAGRACGPVSPSGAQSTGRDARTAGGSRQDELSDELLHGIGIPGPTTCGDCRVFGHLPQNGLKFFDTLFSRIQSTLALRKSGRQPLLLSLSQHFRSTRSLIPWLSLMVLEQVLNGTQEHVDIVTSVAQEKIAGLAQDPADDSAAMAMIDGEYAGLEPRYSRRADHARINSANHPHLLQCQSVHACRGLQCLNFRSASFATVTGRASGKKRSAALFTVLRSHARPLTTANTMTRICAVDRVRVRSWALSGHGDFAVDRVR